MSVQLGFLLTHQLANDDLAALHYPLALELLQSLEPIKHAEAEGRESGAGPASVQEREKAASTLHRWSLRLTSLVTSKSSSAQVAGYALALETSKQSSTLFLQHSKVWYNAALTLLSRKSALPSSGLPASISELLLLCFERATSSQEYAREVANPAGVRKFGEALLSIASNETAELAARVHALESLSRLIRISASPLRPLAQPIQSLSVSLLSQWSHSADALSAKGSAVALLTSVYITAGKAQAGQAWRKTIESVIGSTHMCLNGLASTFVEDYSAPNTFAPLDMPPIPGSSASSSTSGVTGLQPTYQRLEVLLDVLLVMLSSATERAVPVPVGPLVALGQRLMSLTTHSPPRERIDANLHLAQLAILPNLHVQACRLLGQLAAGSGVYLAYYATQLLGLIAFVQGTYPVGSPIRTSFYALTSLVVSGCPIHPDEGMKPVSKIVHSLLEDAAVLALDADEEGRRKRARNEALTQGQKKGAKKLRLFESDEAVSLTQRVTEDRVLCISHALNSLNRILQAGMHLIAPPTINLTLRLLLSFGLSPLFFSAPPSGFSASPSLPALSQAIALCPTLRLSILHCLTTCAQARTKAAPSFAELASGVFRAGATCQDADVRAASRQGIVLLEGLARPAVPPLLKTRAMRVALRELVGGSVTAKLDLDDLGDDEPDMGEEEERRRKQPAASVAQNLPTPSGRTDYTPFNQLSTQPSLSAQPMPPQSGPSSHPGAATNFPATSRATSAQEISLDEPATARVPENAVRPPPPPTEALLDEPTPVVPSSSVSAEEGPDVSSSALPGDDALMQEERTEPPSPRAQAVSVPARDPAANRIVSEEDSSDDDDDAPLPTIVVSDSEDDL